MEAALKRRAEIKRILENQYEYNEIERSILKFHDKHMRKRSEDEGLSDWLGNLTKAIERLAGAIEKSSRGTIIVPKDKEK